MARPTRSSADAARLATAVQCCRGSMSARVRRAQAIVDCAALHNVPELELRAALRRASGRIRGSGRGGA